MNDAVARAARFNRECDCAVADVPALQQRLDATLGDAGLTRSIVDSHPHLFSNTPVFLARAHAERMQRVVSAVGAVAALPAYREDALGRAPAIARAAPKNPGVFFGFDFHIAADGPKLIEINTNAGGALLNVEMRREQQACCETAAAWLRDEPSAELLEAQVFAMFMREWRLARGERSLRTIAIVDDAPGEQYLFPEFLLTQKLFSARGLHAIVVDARDLAIEHDLLTARGLPIDLVYNRSTDFYFSEPGHAALAEAYVRDLAVITPHPHAHALLANKHNLVPLSDSDSLRAMGAAPADIAVLLESVPASQRITGAETFRWEDRKQWFFKPASGFGSRGAYRGDKITRRVFDEVLRGDYIAQNISPPSERWRAGLQQSFKLDVRNFVYDGKSQLLAARLYQGQTTNFRSAGGGFAPVYQLGAAQVSGGLNALSISDGEHHDGGS